MHLKFENIAPDKYSQPDPGPEGSGCQGPTDYKPPLGNPQGCPAPPTPSYLGDRVGQGQHSGDGQHTFDT